MVVGSAVLLATLTVTSVQAVESPQQDGATASAADEVSLPLGYFSTVELGDEVNEAMRTEVRRILAGAGVPVQDFDGDELGGGLNASCNFLLGVIIRDAGPRAWDLQDDAMAVTIGRAMPPRNVYLFYPVIRQTLGITGRRADHLSDRDLGRALAYVIVHELVHAFAPDHKHSGWGITGHRQDSVSLTTAGLTLDPRSGEALRGGWEAARAFCDDR